MVTFYCIELQGTSDKYIVIILLMFLETELQVLLWITVEFPKKVVFHVSRLHSNSFAKGVGELLLNHTNLKASILV